jgi:hypothetical protein
MPLALSSWIRLTKTGAKFLSTSMRLRPSPASKVILLDLSNAKTTATFGLATVLAVMGICHCLQIASYFVTIKLNCVLE